MKFYNVFVYIYKRKISYVNRYKYQYSKTPFKQEIIFVNLFSFYFNDGQLHGMRKLFWPQQLPDAT